MATERRSMFSAPAWPRDLSFASWLLVGFVLIVFGLVWLLGQTSTIVMPVILAAVLGRSVSPAWADANRRELAAHVESPRFQRLSAVDCLIVSEPFSGLPGAWRENPQRRP